MSALALTPETRRGLKALVDAERRRRTEPVKVERREWSSVAVVEAIRGFVGLNGRAPAYADLEGVDELPSPRTIRRYFKNLGAAVEAALGPVYEVEQPTLFEVEVSGSLDKTTEIV